MNSTILTILSLSLSGSVLVLILLALRPVLKNKVSKTFQYYIWLLVLLRLVLPLSIDGSILNQITSPIVKAQASAALAPEDNNEITGYNVPQESGQNAGHFTPAETTPVNSVSNAGNSTVTKQTGFNVWSFAEKYLTEIWFMGAAVYFGWFVIAYMRFSRKIQRTNVAPSPSDIAVLEKLRGNIKVKLVCNPYVHTPMMIGLLTPRIVIPFMALGESGAKPEIEYIIRHEMTHYRRRDLLYKWFAVLVSSLHWFNPLLILVRREISRACELSCDEAVIRSLDADGRQDYGETLLAIASSKRLPKGIVTTTMCEEKRELKERLESIMTYKSKSLLMIAVSLVLALLLAGCSVVLGAAKVNNQAPEYNPAETHTTGIPETPDNEALHSPAATDASGAPTHASLGENDNTKTKALSNNAALEAYNAVLQNQAGFLSTDNGRSLYLNDFLTNKEIYGTDFEISHFTVLDMDGDKVPEVVLELSVGGGPEFYEELHYMDDKIYGYLIVYRGLEALKSDGTFSFSNGVADYGWGQMRFEPSTYKTDMRAYSQSSQGGTELTITYFINNGPATKEEFDSSVNQQAQKEDAGWYEFTQSNIEDELSPNS